MRMLIATLTGPDQVGFVERVTRLVAEFEGNIEASRMARLGGEFTMLMFVAVSEARYEELESGLQSLGGDSMNVTTRPTSYGDPEGRPGWLPYSVKVNGADHQGIIHHVSQLLAERGVNVESMDTETVQAPMSGTPLFTMDAVVLVPPDVSYRDLEKELDELADEMNVDVDVEPYRG